MICCARSVCVRPAVCVCVCVCLVSGFLPCYKGNVYFDLQCASMCVFSRLCACACVCLRHCAHPTGSFVCVPKKSRITGWLGGGGYRQHLCEYERQNSRRWPSEDELSLCLLVYEGPKKLCNDRFPPNKPRTVPLFSPPPPPPPTLLSFLPLIAVA